MLAPLAAAALMGIQVGAAMVATRLVIHDAGPATLALWRYAIGALCLLPAFGPTLWRLRLRLPVRDLLAIAALGTAQFGILIAVLNAGLLYLPASTASLLFATFPLMTLAVAALAGHERLSLPKAVGIALSIAGVGVTLGVRTGADSRGAALVLLSALIGAVCSVLYRPYLRRYPAGPVSLAAMLSAVAALAVYAVLREGLFSTLPAFTPAGWAAILFIGIGSGATYFLLLWALGRAPASVVTAFIALGPVTAALLDALIDQRMPTANALVGLLCVAGGLALAAVRRPAG